MKKSAFILFVATATICSAQQTITIPSEVKKIEVTGSAEMEVVPDEIYIGIMLQEYRNKQKEKVSIDSISKNFLSICQKAGINKDRIEVQNMSGFDNSEWFIRRRKKEQPDLMQSTTYIIKFSNPADIDKLVNLLDDNATNNVYVQKLSNSKETEYRKQLKTQALQNAKEKARYLLEGVGEKVGGLLYVREIEPGDNPYFKVYNTLANSNSVQSNASANEGLNFKKIKYHYEIEAHFAIQ